MADIMNRGDVVNMVAAELELTAPEVDRVLKGFEGAIARQMKEGGEIRMPGFGTFKTTQRAARTSRNPRTGEPIPVAARTALRFIPGKGLKEAAASAPGPAAAKAPAKAKAADAKAAPAKADAKATPAKAAKSEDKAPKAAKAADKAPAKSKKK